MEHELYHRTVTAEQDEQDEDEIFPFAFSVHPFDLFQKQTGTPKGSTSTLILPATATVTPPKAKSAIQGTPNDSPFGSSSSNSSNLSDGSSYLPNKLPDLTASVVSTKSLNSSASELDEDDALPRSTAPSTCSGTCSGTSIVSSSIILSDSLHLESAASLLMQDSRNWAAAVDASTEVFLQYRKPLANAKTASPPGFSQLLDQADDRMEQQQQPQPQQLPTSVTPETTGRAQRRRSLNRSSPRRILRGAMTRLASVTTSLQQHQQQHQQQMQPPCTQLPAVREETDSVAPSSDESTSSRRSDAVGRDGESIVILSEGDEYIETQHQQEQQRAQPLYQNFPRVVTAASTAFAQRSQQERSTMAALAGVTAVTTGRDAFVVSVRVCPNAAEGISSVLDVLGNPELLPLWCGALDEFQHLVIVRRSEDRDANPNRAYEGEWVEATAPLVVPPNTGFVVRWTAALKSALGGTNYGQIALFVERLAGRVSLTLGPFPGNVHVCHRLQVSGDENTSDRILIEDAVRIKRGDDDDDGARGADYCGLLDHCFLPTVQDYMDQVMVSLARLRFLLEQGEQSLYASAIMTLGPVASMSSDPNQTDFHMSSPLLAAS